MMSKVALVAGVLLLIGLVGFSLRSRLPKTSSDTSKTLDGITFTLAKESGSVFYKSATDTEYQPVTGDEASVANGSLVKTGDDGLAHIIFPDNSLASISKNSEMEVTITGNKTSIYQVLGNAWFRIEKLVSGNEFVVETPTTLASVRGTIFGVEIGQSDEVYVTESAVDVAQVAMTGETKEYKNIQKLEAGKLTRVAPITQNPTFEMIDIPEEKKQTGWFRRNQVFNEEFKAGRTRDMIQKMRTDTRLQQIDKETAGEKAQNLNQNPVTTETLRKIVENEKIQEPAAKKLVEQVQTGNVSNNGKELCAFVNSSEYDQSMQQIEQFKAMLGGWVSTLINNASTIKSMCADGVFSESEAKQLDTLMGDEEFPKDFNNFLPNFGTGN